jgi:hypothetical protein
LSILDQDLRKGPTPSPLGAQNLEVDHFKRFLWHFSTLLPSVVEFTLAGSPYCRRLGRDPDAGTREHVS